MNRTDRLYALVEELRAAGPTGRSARRLAERFEVSVRTIERDLDALGQAGVPLRAIQGRRGGYLLDGSMSLPPLNFTPGEAAAVAVALSRTPQAPWSTDARSALRKIVAAMPPADAARAREVADAVRLIVHPAHEPEPDVAREVWRAVREGTRLHLHYVDRGGEATRRDVQPFHVVLGPDGQYLTAWCHLRAGERVFRMDRITGAERVPGRVGPRPAGVRDIPDTMLRRPTWE